MKLVYGLRNVLKMAFFMMGVPLILSFAFGDYYSQEVEMNQDALNNVEMAYAVDNEMQYMVEGNGSEVAVAPVNMNGAEYYGSPEVCYGNGCSNCNVVGGAVEVVGGVVQGVGCVAGTVVQDVGCTAGGVVQGVGNAIDCIF